jgi:hypothetical protein
VLAVLFFLVVGLMFFPPRVDVLDEGGEHWAAQACWCF